MTLRIALYGQNGHQIHHHLHSLKRARLVAHAGIDPKLLQDAHVPGVRQFDSLEQILQDPGVDLVSLCSPRRADQARDAIACLAAGKHVYAEKPCALNEADLDAIMAVAAKSGKRFHEMAGTAMAQPYATMRKIVQAGMIGLVVQVLAQKSYPYFEGRPQDEQVDGGLTMQAGVHATRFVEHVAGTRIREISCIETQLGNPHLGELRMASTMMCRLDNGGVATIVANYCNQVGLGSWGNDALRIFGTLGMLESTDGGGKTRLIIGKQDHGPIDVSTPGADYFDLIVESILDGKAMPFTLEQELHPTRMVIRAKAGAK
jgi:predicted dehydrogenase